MSSQDTTGEDGTSRGKILTRDARHVMVMGRHTKHHLTTVLARGDESLINPLVSSNLFLACNILLLLVVVVVVVVVLNKNILCINFVTRKAAILFDEMKT